MKSTTINLPAVHEVIRDVSEDNHKDDRKEYIHKVILGVTEDNHKDDSKEYVCKVILNVNKEYVHEGYQNKSN